MDLVCYFINRIIREFDRIGHHNIIMPLQDLSPESVQTLIMRCEMPDNENLEERRNSVDSVDSLASAKVSKL
jgi:hypothetical protein